MGGRPNVNSGLQCQLGLGAKTGPVLVIIRNAKPGTHTTVSKLCQARSRFRFREVPEVELTLRDRAFHIFDLYV